MLQILVISLLLSRVNSQLPGCNEERARELNFIKSKITSTFNDCTGKMKWYGAVDENNPTSFTPDNLHRLLFHQVCFEGLTHEKILYVAAKVTQNDMIGSKGTKMFSAVESEIKRWSKLCGCDEGGHTIPRSFGGHGYAANMFAQNGNMNRQIWNRVCNEVSKYVNDTSSNSIIEEKRFAFMEFVFVYGDSTNRFRPSLFYYHFEYSNNNGIVQKTYGLLENEDHSNARLENCWTDTITKLNFASVIDSAYYDRRSCKPDLFPSQKYGPHVPPSEEDVKMNRIVDRM